MKNSQKGFAVPIIIAVIALLAIGGGAYIYITESNCKRLDDDTAKALCLANSRGQTLGIDGFRPDLDNQILPPQPTPNTQPKDKPIACTMDAMQCPDGSYVGRTGPKCEFVCPKTEEINLAKSFLIQMQKDLGITYEIITASKSVNFFEGRKTLSGFSMSSVGLKLPSDTYFNSKGMNQDMYNSGDATFKSSTAFKGDKLICIITSRVINFSETTPEDRWVSQEEIFCAEHDNPPLGESVIELICNPQKCKTSGVSSSRSDFYYQDDSLEGGTRNVKILIDIETRLRYRKSDSESDIIKWVDFYPLITNPAARTFNGAIHGDWIDSNTFKANWIFWPSYPRG